MKEVLFEKVVLGEIEGKNRAIHAYDDIVWKIRSGFLTLVFGGWAILLKAMVESEAPSTQRYFGLGVALFLFSGGFAFGALHIDRSYVQRKFRVIHALNDLMKELAENGGDLDKLSPELLKVSGDNLDISFDGASYRHARKAELAVYLTPLLILFVGVALVFSQSLGGNLR
jgi:hypothetical protein